MKAGLEMELEGRKVGGVTKLRFLKTRHRVLAEQMLNKKMPVLFDTVGVKRKNTHVAPGWQA